MNSGSVEIRGDGDASPVGKRKVACKCLDGAGHPIAARTTQLNEVLRRRKGDEEVSVVAQDSAEFSRVHPCRDRQDDRERAIGVRHEAIGISHNPLASGVAPGGGINGPNRDVDTMSIEAGGLNSVMPWPGTASERTKSFVPNTGIRPCALLDNTWVIEPWRRGRNNGILNRGQKSTRDTT